MNAGPPRVDLALGVPEDDLPLAADALLAQVETVLDAAGLPGSLSLAVVDDAAMRAVNRDYHDCDAPTDVLAFPLSDAPGAGPGFDYEVVVSLDTARREAEERGVAVASELLLYITHGLLHLAGEDDHEPEAAARMHTRTLEILRGLGHRNELEMPVVPRGETRT